MVCSRLLKTASCKIGAKKFEGARNPVLYGSLVDIKWPAEISKDMLCRLAMYWRLVVILGT